MNADVLPCRCERTGEGYGIRVAELQPGVWTATWAFAADIDRLGAQGHVGGIVGTFALGDGYPGCPTCGNGSFMKCGRCEALSCYAGVWKGQRSACAWCRETFIAPTEHMTSATRIGDG